MAAERVRADSAELSDLALSQFIPLHLEERAAFEPAHPRFLLYSGRSYDWMTSYVMDKKYELRLLAMDGDGIYLVQRQGN
jgi:hypothetical protein